MYCPNCGSESTQGLNYCKRCGANLSGAVQTVEVPAGAALTGLPFALAVVGLSVATGVVALGGLGLILAVVDNMARNPTAEDLAKMILVLGIMMVSAISGLLVWQISRLLNLPRKSASAPLQSQRLARPSAPPLASAPSAASVTENTTRNFDPALYRDPKATE
jgi:hypothetical protein